MTLLGPLQKASEVQKLLNHGAKQILKLFDVGPLRRTLNNFIRKDAPGIVTRSIMGHVSEVMTNHYSVVNAK